MSFSGLSGQYGSIPQTVFRQKYEITNVDEPVDAIDNYMRDNLKDLSCDVPFFESDQKREDTHSEEILSLRYSGHRSGETPDAPDLFLELTGRDPRGTQNVPIFSEAAKHTWDKRESFKFYNDSDMSVTEREKRPQVLIAQIRDQFENIKERLKWFSTSKDNFLGISGRKGESADSRVGLSGSQYAMTHRDVLSTTPKGNLTTLMSNTLPLGWEQTGDHEFKVASYGQIRNGIDTSKDVESNRSELESEHRSNLVIFKEQIVSVGLVNLMKTVIDDRQQRAQSGEWQPGFSRAQINSIWRPMDNVINRADNYQGDQIQQEAFKNIEKFIGQLNRQTGVLAQNDIETQLQIIQFMDHATRSSSSNEAKFTAQNIIASTRQIDAFANQGVIRGNQKMQTSKREIEETTKRFESYQVARLGRSRLTDVGDKLAINLVGENYKSKSAERDNLKTRGPDVRNPYSADITQKRKSFGTADRFVRGLGSKFTRDKTDTDRTLNDMADMS